MSKGTAIIAVLIALVVGTFIGKQWTSPSSEGGTAAAPAAALPDNGVERFKIPAGNGPLVLLRSGAGEHRSIVTAAVSIDAALVFAHFALVPPTAATQNFALASTSVQDAPRPRLDRPPRA